MKRFVVRSRKEDCAIGAANISLNITGRGRGAQRGTECVSVGMEGSRGKGQTCPSTPGDHSYNVSLALESVDFCLEPQKRRATRKVGASRLVSTK